MRSAPIVLLLLSACATVPPPARIEIALPSPLYPEGVAYDRTRDTFLVGSVRTGVIGAVDGAHRYQSFSEDPDLVSSIGLYVDAPRNRLLAAVSDIGVSTRSVPTDATKLARVVALDLTTGARLQTFELGHLHPGAHLANDLTVDTAGNIYVTDSFSPVIYRVSAAGDASVWAESPMFEPEKGAAPGSLNLNGILAHPAGFLLVAHYSKGKLLRVSTADPREIAAVEVEGELGGADGLLLNGERELIVLRSVPGKSGAIEGRATLLRSEDGWKSAARVAELSFAGPLSTAARRKGEVYAVEFPFPEFFANPAAASTRKLTLVRLAFPGVDLNRP